MLQEFLAWKLYYLGGFFNPDLRSKIQTLTKKNKDLSSFIQIIQVYHTSSIHFSPVNLEPEVELSQLGGFPVSKTWPKILGPRRCMYKPSRPSHLHCLPLPHRELGDVHENKIQTLSTVSHQTHQLFIPIKLINFSFPFSSLRLFAVCSTDQNSAENTLRPFEGQLATKESSLEDRPPKARDCLHGEAISISIGRSPPPPSPPPRPTAASQAPGTSTVGPNHTPARHSIMAIHKMGRNARPRNMGGNVFFDVFAGPSKCEILQNKNPKSLSLLNGFNFSPAVDWPSAKFKPSRR